MFVAPYTQCFSVSLVFGIPTIKREKMSYLLDTLASLLDGMSQADKDDSVIVIFIGEVIIHVHTHCRPWKGLHEISKMAILIVTSCKIAKMRSGTLLMGPLTDHKTWLD